ncbi:MAG: 30S ribosomal protein S13 [Candidatus Altiarchaeales archaeon]|nr:MAG: 30S ribosomal protein S13 [Candidatus Altiarchaeales archaeon]
MDVKESIKSEDFRHRVRISGVVIDGNLDLYRAFTRIKGIGSRVSYSLLNVLDMDPKRRVGTLSDSEIERLEDVLNNIHKYLPGWMLNRQRDPYSGENIHLIGPDLEMAQREDINLQKKIKSYRGIRHSLGLPVRGQRTRTSFRKGQTVGVMRKRRK